MHGKERAMATLLERELGVTCYPLEDFNTDQLGTFTGQVNRVDDPLTTARKKAKFAMQASGFDLAIASEGTFGPHPDYYFIPADEEILVLVDAKNELEVIVHEWSTVTNFNAADISTISALHEFANVSQFPSHALILRPSKQDFSDIVKGITDWRTLENNFNRMMQRYGTVYVETDMRAMHNPSRIEVIRQATESLIKKIKMTCPSCGCPGFNVKEVIAGLPCESCQFPTRSTSAYRYACQRCEHTSIIPFPHGKQTEDPMYCDVCNP